MRLSSSSALRAERPVVAPDWLIALLTGLVCVSLWLLYPRQDLERRLTGMADSELSIAYVTNLLRSDPGNPRLRLMLAKSQTARGDTIDARVTLQPALDSPDRDIHRDALWALWDLSNAQYQHTLETSTELRAAMLQSLQDQLRVLARESWPPERQRRLAALARQFNQPALGPELNSQLAELETTSEGSAEFYERAAREALATSDYASCAAFYIKARGATNDPAKAKAYYLAAAKALQSGNQPVAALALAERELGNLADDTEVLLFITNLARAAGRPDVAERYVRRLLRLAQSRPFSSPLDTPKAELAVTDRAAKIQAVVLNLFQNEPVVQTAQTKSNRYDDGAYLLDDARQRRLALWQPGKGTTSQWPVRLIAVQNATTKPVAAPESLSASLPTLPYDEKIYTLGYQVFLENRNLEGAWAVAQAAVQQRPGGMVWRQRLAQVSEWTLRLDVALTHWLVLARNTQQESAWQSVLRLAPGQFDDDALVQALRHELVRKPDDPKLTRAFVDAAERLGTPQPALDYLQKHANSPETLEILAVLAERAGQPKLALETWRRLLNDPVQNTPQRAMRAAVLALTQGLPDEGLQWLQTAQARPPSGDTATDFWRLTGNLAESRRQNSAAIDAYRELIKTEGTQVGDYDGLIRMLMTQQPLEAAKVAAFTWQRYHESRHLMQALTVYANQMRWDAFAALLQRWDTKRQTPNAEPDNLIAAPEFLRLVGTWHQSQGRIEEARRFYERGLSASPDSVDMQQALLWLFIDGNDTASLRTVLAKHEKTWSRSADVHDALAAAYQALSLPQTALNRYLSPRLPTRQNDFLWLMNYADALDQNQQPDRAWRLRRHLLSSEWRAANEKASAGDLSHADARKLWLSDEGINETRRIARARLIITQRPGDPAAQVLRELLRVDSDAPGQYSNAAAETAIGWLQDAGQYGAERRFLWHQYARSRGKAANRPLWAEITLALAEKDRAASGQLLEQFDERLPRYDRINAASAAQDLRLAQTAAFEAQGHQVDDAPLHLQLTENLLAFSDHIATQLAHINLGGTSENREDVTLHLALSPRLSLDVQASAIQRTAADATVIRNPPDEKRLEARLNWRHLDGETMVSASRRQGAATTSPFQLSHEQRIDDRLSFRVDLGAQLPTDESLVLRIAGMKRMATASLRYQITRLDQVNFTHSQEQYSLQTGTRVGRGQHTTLQYTHTYRQDAPSLEGSAFLSTHSYSRGNPGTLAGDDVAYRRYLPPDTGDVGNDFFLPDNFRFYGIELSTNMRYAREYSRAVRPYASLSGTWHSELGPGYGVRFGVAGSVLANDHLAMSFGLSRSGIESRDITRDMAVSYRLHF